MMQPSSWLAKLKQTQAWRIHRSKEYLDSLRVAGFRMASRFLPPDEELVIVSGADHKFFPDALQLFESVQPFEAQSRFIFYDLGLTDAQRLEMNERFPRIEVRTFDFSRYPDYFDITSKAGEYAWKPVIISEVFNECRSQIVWMDSRNVLTGRLMDIRMVLRVVGVYSPTSTGEVGALTHSGMMRYLRAKAWMNKRSQLSGGLVAFRFASKSARAIVDEWCKCALDRHCIAPPGSDRTNHRQDQSALSILCYQRGVTRFMPRKKLGILVHRDVS